MHKKNLTELVTAIIILVLFAVIAWRSFPEELVQKSPVIAVRLEPQKNQKSQNLIVKVESKDAAPEKLTRLDFALFVAQSITTTGYGNYNDLFANNPWLKVAAILLMTGGAATWTWLIAILVRLKFDEVATR